MVYFSDYGRTADGRTGRSDNNAISTQVEVVVEVGVDLYVAGADNQYTFPDGLRTIDYGRVEVIIMLSQLLDVAVVEAGAELGNYTK